MDPLVPQPPAGSSRRVAACVPGPVTWGGTGVQVSAPPPATHRHRPVVTPPPAATPRQVVGVQAGTSLSYRMGWSSAHAPGVLVPAPPAASRWMAALVPAPPFIPEGTPWPNRIAMFILHMLRWLIIWMLVLVIVPAVFLGWRPISIVGDSMNPTIRIGDVIMADPDAEPEVGDVVTYNEDRRGLITHRLQRFDDDGNMILRGDANRVEDEPVPTDRVVGIGRLLLPAAALPITWVRTGNVPAIVSMVGLAGLLLYGRRSGVAPAVRRVATTSLPLALVGVTVVGMTMTDAAFLAVTANLDNTIAADPVPAGTGLATTCSTPISDPQVGLTWTPSTSTNDVSQTIQRQVDGGGFSDLAVVGAGDAGYTDTAVSYLSTYDYRIRTDTGTSFTATSATATQVVSVLTC